MVLKNRKLTVVNYTTFHDKLKQALMKKGKKSKIERIILKTTKLLRQESLDKQLLIKNCLSSLSCPIILNKIRLSGNIYQVPAEVNLIKQNNLSIKLIKESINEAHENTLKNQLYKELININQKKGTAYKKKEQLLTKAEANRAFAHYRW